jgi:transcriptional antiterminator RfaH
MGMQWFVPVTAQGKETWAKRELENQGFQVYLPMYIGSSAKAIIRPFLPTYLFVRADLNDKNIRWRAIFSTYGVKRLIMSGERPQAVADWIIEEIMGREVGGFVRLPPKVQCKFSDGDKVKLKGSPLEAIFHEAIDRQRAAIFVSLLGRSYRRVVPLAKLTAASVVNATA